MEPVNMTDVSAAECKIVESRRLVFLGEGTTRRVYTTRSGRYVIKFATGCRGETANYWEASEFRQMREGRDLHPMAKCRLINLGEVCCLIMELVKPVMWQKGLPEWCNAIDCCQVGYTRRNKLVAYDWA